MTALDDYINNVIAKGDEGSRLLASITAPTLKNDLNLGKVRIVQDGMNGLAVLDVPRNYAVVVHSVGGDLAETDLEGYTHSLVGNLFATSLPRSYPVAFANVVDSNSGDIEMLRTIGESLRDAADTFGMAILNGENAVLGDRVSSEANLSGTLISLMEKKHLHEETGTMRKDGIDYAFFDPMGKPVIINSDGVGTKTEFYERSGAYELAVLDFMAMNLDDAIKLAATPRVISGVLEYSGDIPIQRILDVTQEKAKSMGLVGILQPEELQGRIRGYKEHIPTYNISGSVVSTIDEQLLNDPLRPNESDTLVAIRSRTPNPRSNGITARRQLMKELGKEWTDGEWHETEQGKTYLEFLASPSTVFYPVFRDLIDEGLATGVYHMSGGAFNGKLARPLRKAGLSAVVYDIFPPSDVEMKLYEASGASAKSAYENWPMGNEAFITTSRPTQAIRSLNKRGLDAVVVGRLVADDSGIKIVTPMGDRFVYNGQ